MKTYLKRIWSRLLATFAGLQCDRCGKRGASLVIDAVRTSREESDGGRVRRSTFTVRSCSALCQRCRGR